MHELGWELPLIVLKGLVFVLFVISIGANLLGNVVLAKFLSRGSLGVLFGGFFHLRGQRGAQQPDHPAVFDRRGPETPHIVRLYRDTLLPQLQRIVRVGAVVYWIVVVLGSFLIFRPVLSSISAALSRQFRIGEISLSLRQRAGLCAHAVDFLLPGPDHPRIAAR
jgi:hypothetical protein